MTHFAQIESQISQLAQQVINADLLDKQKRKLLKDLELVRKETELERTRGDFLTFVQQVWTTDITKPFVVGNHHKIMAQAFQEALDSKKKRIIINMPPRHTKSELTSWMLPAFAIGHNPGAKIMQICNNQDLASGFGRRVRNLVDTKEFQEIFPGVKLSRDSTAQNNWNTNKGGSYFAVGVGGKVTGKGADLLVIDDPHSEQEAKAAERNPAVFDDVYDWYTSGPRQRLQPGGVLIIVMTRWGVRDLTGRVLSKQKQLDLEAEALGLDFALGDQWHVITLPAIWDENTLQERLMWPGLWSLDEIKATRATLPVAKWKAQYQQEPTSEEGAIIKREYWREWKPEKPPPCFFIIQSWDTALTVSERADFSACTTWGVFEYEDPESGKTVNNVILLDAWKRRVDFPSLKRKAIEMKEEYNPDIVLIESRNSGTSLIQELRMTNIPVADFTPARGKKGVSNDKVARANMITDIFSSGYVWAPPRRFAEEVIEECAAFPNGEHDDYVDTVTQALIRFRQGGLVATANDHDAWTLPQERRKRAAYY